MNKRPVTYLLHGLLPFFFNGFATAQDPLQALVGKLENFRKSYPQEKVHLHLDKPFYSVGDTLYFKAYVVNAEDNSPSGRSALLYVDLVDQNDSVTSSSLLPVNEGLASGVVVLPDHLEEGAYRIRAYTAWMRNFDEAYFFDRTISVGNALTNDLITAVVIRLPEKTKTEAPRAFLTCRLTNGAPLAGKEIGYSVRMAAKEVLSGTVTTNGNGEATVTLPLALPVNTPGRFITRVKTAGKKPGTSNTAFQLPAEKYSIRFFPEGGRMITGLPCKIGVKAVDEQECGQEFTGTVTDEKGTKVASFSSLFAGMGSFGFTPLPDRTYTAVVRLKNGTEQKIPLPPAEEEGYLLSIDNNSDPDKLLLKIGAAGTAVNRDVMLIAQANHVIHYASKTGLTANGIAASLSKSRFPTGIVQFTLFNDAYQPVAERLVFIQHDDALKIAVSTAGPSFAKREKVRLAVEVKDEAGEPVAGSFSIAVTDAGKAPPDEAAEQTVFTDLLLSADLRGYIETPNRYFTAPAAQRSRALDNLLLTQGWRRFVWKDLIAGDVPALVHPAEKDLAISGTVTTLKGVPAAGAKVALLMKGANGFLTDTVTDAQGRFRFGGLYVTDDGPFTVQAEDKNGNSNVQLILDARPQQAVGTHRKGNGAYAVSNPAFAVYLKNSADRFAAMKAAGEIKNGTTLQAVTVKARKLTKKEEALQASNNLNGPGNADQVLTYEDLRGCNDLAMCLQGRLTGVIFKRTEAGMLAYSTSAMKAPPRFDTAGHILPATPAERMGIPMLMVVDGVTQAALGVSSIPAADVQAIEVLRGARTLMYGTHAQAGVLIITTKRGGMDYDGTTTRGDRPKNIVFGAVKGYQQRREFYAPDYSREKQNKYADLRSTVFWDPHVVTDEEGKASVAFYTADTAGTYNVVVEGISENGKGGRAVYSFTVQ